MRVGYHVLSSLGLSLLLFVLVYDYGLCRYGLDGRRESNLVEFDIYLNIFILVLLGNFCNLAEWLHGRTAGHGFRLHLDGVESRQKPDFILLFR